MGHRGNRHSCPIGSYITETTSSSWYFSYYPHKSFCTSKCTQAFMHVRTHSHNTHTYLQTPSQTALGVCVCRGCFCLCLLSLSPDSAFLM